jgi:phospholipid-binding lipoprotein MlaA
MRARSFPDFLRLIAALCLFAFATSCASVSGPPNKRDPLESYNRGMFKINDNIDKAVVKPVSRTYDKITPSPLKKALRNFFGNLGEVPVVFNDLLQFKFQQAAYDSWRFIFNTTLGLGGIIDVASDIGLEKHDEDFGQTLGKWGVPAGPYFVIPILGPSTIRDASGRLVDSPLKPIGYVTPTSAKLSIYAADGVITRASLLGASNVLDQAALDPYVFVRDAYMQRRLKQIYDGKVPQEKLDELDGDDEPMDEKPNAEKSKPEGKAEEMKKPTEETDKDKTEK